MKKQIISLIAVIAVGALLFVGYKFLFAPETTQGEKQVTLQIIAADQNIDKTFELDTDTELMFDLLIEYTDDLGLVYEEYDFGPMITGLMGYTADAGKQEYYHLIVNGADAMTGPKEIPVTDGDAYIFELRTW